MAGYTCTKDGMITIHGFVKWAIHILDQQDETKSWQVKNVDHKWSCHVKIFAIFAFKIGAHLLA